MMTLAGAIIAQRGEDQPQAGQWRCPDDRYLSGDYSLAVLRGLDPGEPVLAEIVPARFTVEAEEEGPRVTLDLTADDIAAAQGPRRPVTEFLFYRLRHDGAEIFSACFVVIPSAACVEGTPA